jgi:uncharacterized membrane protein
MEDLAMLVVWMLIVEMAFSLITVGFCLAYRFTGKFKKTAMTILAIMSGWLFGGAWQMGVPGAVALIASILFLYIPSRRKK